MQQSNKIIAAGPSLVKAASAIIRPASSEWPFPWLFPTPSSRHVMVTGSVRVTDYGTNFNVASYTVPEGSRFVLTHVVWCFFGSGWNMGSGDLTATLLQTSSPGNHAVDYFNRLTVPLGSFVPGCPWPVHGRLEYDANDELTWFVQAVQNVELNTYASAAIIGYTYPINGV